jgi:hypothetical protein
MFGLANFDRRISTCENPHFSSVLTAAHPKSVVTSFYGTNFGFPGYLTLIPV